MAERRSKLLESVRRLFGFLPPESPSEPPSSPTFSEPWRRISWGDKAKNLKYVQEYNPENENIKHLRILLYGPVGAGKSSFINSVSNVLRGKMTTPALASAITSDKSFTKKYETHKIRKGRTTSFYPFLFNDIMGLEEEAGSGARPQDIELALKGHVMEGYKFNPASSLSETDSGYNPNPSPDDKVHVLVCVLSANVSEIKKPVLQKMAHIREVASDMGIPQMIIMTNIDGACPETEKDLKNVYKSKDLKMLMKEFSSTVGVPMNCVFPVKNYSEEIETSDDVDVLILSALRQMIDFGDDFIGEI